VPDERGPRQTLDEDRDAYRYDRFTTRLLLEDMRFSRHAPRPGDRFPQFELASLQGGLVRSGDLLGRPYLLTLGSLTCPMTAGAAEALVDLYREFGAEIPFITTYAREAHPGDYIPQPQDVATKAAHARRLAERDGFRWRVTIDDLDGTLHQQLDRKPNAAFLVGADGCVVFRSLWSADTMALRAAMLAITRGEAPRQNSSTAMIGPMLRALPWIDRTIRSAGPRASRDLWRAAPPMALMALAGRLFPRRH